MVSSFSNEWNGLGLEHLGLLCSNSLSVSHCFFPGDVWFSATCLKTIKPFSDGFTAANLWTFLCIVKGSKYTQSGTKSTENSNNSHRNLAISHLGWSQKCHGREWIKASSLLSNHSKIQTLSFFRVWPFSTVNPVFKADLNCMLSPGKSAFCLLSSGIKVISYLRKKVQSQGDLRSYVLSCLKSTGKTTDN